MSKKLSGRMKRSWEDRFWRAYHIYIRKRLTGGHVPDSVELWALHAYGMNAIFYTPVGVAEALKVGDFQIFFCDEKFAQKFLRFFSMPRTDKELLQGPN